MDLIRWARHIAWHTSPTTFTARTSWLFLRFAVRRVETGIAVFDAACWQRCAYTTTHNISIAADWFYEPLDIQISQANQIDMEQSMDAQRWLHSFMQLNGRFVDDVIQSLSLLSTLFNSPAPFH
jgi:hypothetical protein